MKTQGILTMVLAVVFIGCGEKGKRIGMTKAKADLRSLGSMIGAMEYGLQTSTHPGQIALGTEKLREAKEELEKERLMVAAVIPMEASGAIAETARRHRYQEMAEEHRQMLEKIAAAKPNVLEQARQRGELIRQAREKRESEMREE